jgi:predicted esterase
LRLASLTTSVTLCVGAPRLARAEEVVDRWCAPELEAITESVCLVGPESSGDPPPIEKGRGKRTGKTLVIFLHSLVGQSSPWAWQQQRLIRRMAHRHGLYGLIPRGRPGFGPGRDPKVIAWPTARALQEAHEDSLLAEWTAARTRAEARVGHFERVLVFGFSNGAYYATSLALRGKLPADGFAVFAGGNGGKYHRILAERTERRAPIFVGYGTRDHDHSRQEHLVELLSELSWPHAHRAEPIGHTVSNAQLDAALAYLLGPESEPPSDEGDER